MISETCDELSSKFGSITKKNMVSSKKSTFSVAKINDNDEPAPKSIKINYYNSSSKHLICSRFESEYIPNIDPYFKVSKETEITSKNKNEIDINEGKFFSDTRIKLTSVVRSISVHSLKEKKIRSKPSKFSNNLINSKSSFRGRK